MRPLLVPLVAAALIPWTSACGGAAGPTYQSTCSADGDCPGGYICESGACTTGFRNGTGGAAGSGGSSGSGGAGGSGDTTGPTISFVTPFDGELVTGIIDIGIRATDASGINEALTKVTVASRCDVPLTPGTTSGRYQGTFDTANAIDTTGAPCIPDTALSPSITLEATDNAGNANTAGIQFYVDNTAPIVSLTSPAMYLRRKNKTDPTQWECSQPFDPLGTSAVRHGDIIDSNYLWGTVFYPRARIEDRGNSSTAWPSTVRVAGVDRNTVKLYLLDKAQLDAGHKLVVGDGSVGARCDTIDPDGAATVQDLAPVPVSGAANFTPAGSIVVSARCNMDGTEEPPPPDPVCLIAEATDMTVWIGYSVSGIGDNATYFQPAVYALGYDSASSLSCTGRAFDAQNLTTDGPACLAVAAADSFGNLGVSEPIAICIDKDGVGGECIGFNADNVRQSCADGCNVDLFSTDINSRQIVRDLLGQGVESCVGYCEAYSPAGCFCDSQCTTNGDCCSDYSAVCRG